MTPTYKLDSFIGKKITLNGVSTINTLEGVLVEFNPFGVLLETDANSKGAMFYPWHAITYIDVSQAYQGLKSVA